MLYDFTVIGLRPNMLGMVLPRLQAAVEGAVVAGTLLGCFSCEFGLLNRFAILTAYRDDQALAADRAAMVASGDPYGLGEYIGSIDRAAYRPLDFMTDVEPGKYGPFYEVRTYAVAPGGLQATSDAWSKVVPRRTEISKLLMVMASLDAAPQRMLHIWPYKTLDERVAARAAASKEGIWPPPGGSTHLLSLQSELFVATTFSPLG
jgi:hypothetical protein